MPLGAQPSEPGISARPVLTNVAQVATLPLVEARAHTYSVKVRGLLTYQPPETDHWIVIEHDGFGVQVYLADDSRRYHPYTWVEVEGIVDTTTFATIISEARVEELETRPPLPPLEPPVAEVSGGKHHARWIKLTGAVLDIAMNQGRPVLLMCTQGVSYNLFLAETHAELPMSWWNGVIEAQGVALSRIDIAGQPSGFYLVTASNSWIRVVSPGHSNLLAGPIRTSRELNEISSPNDERLHVSGVVTYVSPRGWFGLEDATGPLWVTKLIPISQWSKESVVLPRPPPEDLRPGDLVEAVGSLSQQRRFTPHLDYSEFRVVGRAEVPAPTKTTAAEIMTGRYDFRRVSVEGRLMDQETTTSGGVTLNSFWLRAGEQLFKANIYGTNAAITARSGDLVRVEGLCMMLPLEYQTPRTFNLFPLAASGIVRLRQPPLWLTPAVMRVAIGAAFLVGVVLLWVWALRRQVADRTASLATVNAQLSGEIDERKKAQVELHRALAAERELGELKSRFVSLVSHEFRTPLGITMSAVELLRNYLDRLTPTKREELLSDIYNSTLRMSSLMEQVLLLGRVEAGKIGFQPAPLDLAMLCGKLVDESLSATHRKCPIAWSETEPLEGARGDESLLRHIFSNLLSNAVKYSSAEQPVKFSVAREGDDAVFRVQDNGIGIPEKDQAKLFEAFHRGTNVGQTPGTGLGMLIVKRCVDMHGGTIECFSEENVGTTFTVKLPLFALDP